MFPGSLRRKILARPRYLEAGKIGATFLQAEVDRRDENVLCALFALHRRLFGAAYADLANDHYPQMAKGSGVFIGGLIQTSHLVPNATFPGDIDLLLIPYADDELILDRTMAIEVKAVRNTYSKQGRGPNQFGFSQANGLLNLGFPYVSVVHLVVSDESPRHAWRPVAYAKILDADSGRCEIIEETYADLMPGDLIDRALGRLERNCDNDLLGLLAAYIIDPSIKEERDRIWFPEGRSALRNPRTSAGLLHRVGDYFNQNPHLFMDTPKFSPILI